MEFGEYEGLEGGQCGWRRKMRLLEVDIGLECVGFYRQRSYNSMWYRVERGLK